MILDWSCGSLDCQCKMLFCIRKISSVSFIRAEKSTSHENLSIIPWLLFEYIDVLSTGIVELENRVKKPSYRL